MRKSSMNQARIVLLVSLAWLLSSLAFAQEPQEQSAKVRKQKITSLLDSAQGQATDKAPRVGRSKTGYLHHVGFPGGRGAVVVGAKKGDPQDIALKFVGNWRDAFVNPTDKVAFEITRNIAHEGRSYLHLQQKYRGLKVYDGEISVQVDGVGRVNNALSDIMTDTGVLDRGELSLAPTLTSLEATQKGLGLFSSGVDAATLAQFTVSEPELMIFHPAIMDIEGPTRLVWQMIVRHAGQPLIAEKVLVDAHDGQIPLHFSLIQNAKYRKIYDKNGATGYTLGTLKREEGQPESDVPAVNLGYLFCGDDYDRYYSWHSLDSYDNAGQYITASVRWGGEMGEDNSCWDPSQEHMFLGRNLLFDDVTMHEFTHGVTQHHSNLDYSGESGGMNESFSDMWGEWFDQERNYNSGQYGYTNNDGIAYDWLLGEDYSGGPIRSMSNPPTYSDPDRYGDSYWKDHTDVHDWSGVGNKLCYLLTNGASFNGFSITGTATRHDAADLFFQAQLNLTSSSDYLDFYAELIEGAETLGYTESQILNLEKACQSVNIRDNSGIGKSIKDDTGNGVGFIDDSGQLLLKRTLTEGALSPIDTSEGGFIVKDDSGTVVAFINMSSGSNGGQMKILGTKTENTIPAESSDNVFVLRYEGVIVMSIDKNGNLKLWRTVAQL